MAPRSILKNLDRKSSGSTKKQLVFLNVKENEKQPDPALTAKKQLKQQSQSDSATQDFPLYSAAEKYVFPFFSNVEQRAFSPDNKSVASKVTFPDAFSDPSVAAAIDRGFASDIKQFIGLLKLQQQDKKFMSGLLLAMATSYYKMRDCFPVFKNTNLLASIYELLELSIYVQENNLLAKEASAFFQQHWMAGFSADYFRFNKPLWFSPEVAKKFQAHPTRYVEEFLRDHLDVIKGFVGQQFPLVFAQLIRRLSLEFQSGELFRMTKAEEHQTYPALSKAFGKMAADYERGMAQERTLAVQADPVQEEASMPLDLLDEPRSFCVIC